MSAEQYEALLDALTAIADFIENRHETAPGVWVGRDIREIREAIDRARRSSPAPERTP